MANRIIRSGFLDSEKINSLKESDQLFFVRLMLVADDYGHLDARTTFLRSHCYPVMNVTTEKVSRMLENLLSAALITKYSFEGKDYIEIVNFGQRLRTMRYKYPCPQSAAACGNPPPESESEVEVEVEVEDKKGKIQPDKPVADNRHQAFIVLFSNYWKNSRHGNPPIQGKDGAQLKSMLRRQPVMVADDFSRALVACDSDQFHAKNLSLAYVCSKYELLINQGVSNGKSANTNSGRFIGEFEKNTAIKYNGLR